MGNNDRHTISLILGSYINGYSIIRELSEKSITNIALFSYGKSLAWFSNKVIFKAKIDKTHESLKKELFKLKEKCKYIVIFPTDDLQLENLSYIYDDIKDFCYVPFNNKNIIKSLDKYYQYRCCEKYNVPYPKTLDISTLKGLNNLAKTIKFPVLFKPNKRSDMTTSVFRSLYLKNNEEFQSKKHIIEKYLTKGISFLASEYIPGDDTNIYAYVGYRSKKGEILNEWIGKKLTQFPDKFGVFSSASNEAPEIVIEQGRTLLNEMNIFGIAEPEFKLDHRDGKYKLMEINLRSMMWHRLGSLCNVNLHYTQLKDAIGEKTAIDKQVLVKEKRIHMVYLKHELINLFFRKKYWNHFKYNVFKGDVTSFVSLDKKDIKPFLYDITIGNLKQFILLCLKVLNVK